MELDIEQFSLPITTHGGRPGRHPGPPRRPLLRFMDFVAGHVDRLGAPTDVESSLPSALDLKRTSSVGLSPFVLFTPDGQGLPAHSRT